MTEVLFLKHLLIKNLQKTLNEIFPRKFSGRDKVVIKAHMGEWGNLFYVRPPIIGVVAEALKNAGANPFVFDTPTAYQGSRYTTESYTDTARRNGFTSETVGCPVVISDEGVPVKSRYISKMELARHIKESDGMVVVSHFKGHELTNWGGAIKNLGMGAFTKASKSAMHRETQPEIKDGCTGCGTCVRICPFKAISLKDSRAVINKLECYGCCACADNCPAGVIKIKTARLSRVIAEAASLAVKGFDPKKLFYVNVLLDISKVCDCLPIGEDDAGPIVCPDLGILLSDNIVAVDRASLDLVQRATSNRFGKLFPARLTEQLDAARDFGLGTGEYTLKEL